MELFDTVSLTCTRYGWIAKAFEVLGRKWSIDGGIELTLRETASSVYAFGGTFDAVDAAPNTLLPSPWVVPAITGLWCESGTAWLMLQADGTVTSRLHVYWDAVTDAAVLQSGKIEVRYGMFNQPESAWMSVEVPGTATSIDIAGVQDGMIYVIKVRAKNSLVSGAWSLQLSTRVVGKQAAPSNVVGLRAVNDNGSIRISWDPCLDADYWFTEIRYGSSWAAGATVVQVSGSAYLWPFPGVGTYQIWVCHADTSRIASAIPQGISVSTSYPAGYVNLLWGSENGPVSAGPGAYGAPSVFLKRGASNPYGLQPGDTLTVSADLWQDATSLYAGQNATIFLYDSLSNGVWQAETVTITSSSTTASRRSQTMTLPTDPAKMYEVGIGLFHQGGSSNTIGTVYADRIQVELGSVATQYTPGAQPGATVGATFGVNINGTAATEDISAHAATEWTELYDAAGVSYSNMG